MPGGSAGSQPCLSVPGDWLAEQHEPSGGVLSSSAVAVKPPLAGTKELVSPPHFPSPAAVKHKHLKPQFTQPKLSHPCVLTKSTFSHLKAEHSKDFEG